MQNLNKTEIKNLFYEIRGKQVLLDQDIARIFECKSGTKSLHLAIKRNSKRFPKDFYFRLTNIEYQNIKNVPQNNHLNFDTRNLPLVFTKPGFFMLATLLNTDVAIKSSIRLVRAFENF